MTSPSSAPRAPKPVYEFQLLRTTLWEFPVEGYKPPQTVMQLRYAMEMNRYGERALRNRLNKAGYDFHLIFKARGKTDCSARIASALSILRGFPLTAWTGFFAADANDYKFEHDYVHLAFFFEHEANAFATVYEALQIIDEEMEAAER